MKTYNIISLAAAAAMVSLAILSTGCTHNDYPDANGDNNNNNNDKTLVITQNKSWTVVYKGRELYTETDGSSSEVERFHVEGTGNQTYTVSILSTSDLNDYYKGNLENFFKDEADNLANTAKNNNQKIADVMYSGDPLDILFDRIRHGEWKVYIIGLNADGSPTGEYSVSDFLIEEEEPLADFTKWEGVWTIGDSNTSYSITLKSSESNLAYTVENWEAGENLTNNMAGEIFEAFYDKPTGNLVFVSQYIGPYTANGVTVYDYFLGNINYTGSTIAKGLYPVTTEGLDIAMATYSSKDGKITATVAPCKVDINVSETETFSTSFTSMQFLSYSSTDNTYTNYNDKIPSLPMSMLRTADAKTSSLSVKATRLMPATKAEERAMWELQRPAIHKEHNIVRLGNL